MEGYRMIENIRKRDGRLVAFELDKIAGAIYKAFEASGGKYELKNAMNIAKTVETKLEKKKSELPTVELVQDTVEEVLIEQGYVRVAKAYILYRANRTRERDMKSRLMKTFEEITFADSKDSDLKRENANVNADAPMGTMLKYGAEAAKQFNEMFVLNPKHARAHINGDIHIHDMDFLTLTTTCCQIDLIKLFAGGFSTGHGVLREPNSIMSYGALAAIAIQSNQNDQHGGQSIPFFDYNLAKGVYKTFRKLYIANLNKGLKLLKGIDDKRAVKDIVYDTEKSSNKKVGLEKNPDYLYIEKEKLIETFNIEEPLAVSIQNFAYDEAYKETDRQTYQSMEGFIHNLNTMHSRAGAQVPFSSINFGTDTSPEGRMVSKNLLLSLEKGLGNGETAIFPILIFKVKEGVNLNPEDPNYDLFKLSCRVSAKRLFPNFSFLDAPFNLKTYIPGKPETETTYMGCRTRVMGNVCGEEVASGRGNLSFTTINLPRLGIKYGIVNGRTKKDLDGFFNELDEKIDLVIDQLLERMEIQGNKRVKNFPFLMGQGIWRGSDNLSPEDTLKEVIKQGTLT